MTLHSMKQITALLAFLSQTYSTPHPCLCHQKMKWALAWGPCVHCPCVYPTSSHHSRMLHILDLYCAYQPGPLEKCIYQMFSRKSWHELSLSLFLYHCSCRLVFWLFSKSLSGSTSELMPLSLPMIFPIVSEAVILTGSSQDFLPNVPGASSNNKCICSVWKRKTAFEPRSHLSVVIYHALGLLLGTEAERK